MVTALSGLMRVALRSEDWHRLDQLCEEGASIATAAGDETLLRMPLHMRAEAARAAEKAATVGGNDGKSGAVAWMI